MTILGILLAIVALLAVVIFLARQLFARAMRDLLRTFVRLEALEPASAVSSESLGIVNRGLFGGMTGLRDYRPEALRILMQADVVRRTAEGRLYLLESKLQASKLSKYADTPSGARQTPGP